MMRAITILLIPFVAVVLACNGTEAGSTTTPSTALTRLTPDRLGLVDDDSVEPPADAPRADDAPAGPVSAFAGHFERVPLLPGTAQIVDVAGRSERDVWLLAKDGAVLHWDGARTIARGTARCFVDACCGHLFDCSRRPARCSKSAVERCQAGDRDCVLSVEWSWLRLTSDGVIAGALVFTGGLRGTLVEARLDPSGRWSCEQGKGPVNIGAVGHEDGLQALVMSVDGAQIRFEGPAFLQGVYSPHSLLVDGRLVPLPDEVAVGDELGFDARGPGDLWLWESSRLSRGRRGDGGNLSVLVATPEAESHHGRLWHGNGLTWTPMRTGFAALADVWFSEPDTTWLLGPVEKKKGSERLIRRDLDWNVKQRFDTPGAAAVLRGDQKDFWLLGVTTFYYWDGDALHRVEAPLDIKRGWRSPAGEVWVVGSIQASGAKGDRSEARAGAAFRLPAPERRKP